MGSQKAHMGGLEKGGGGALKHAARGNYQGQGALRGSEVWRLLRQVIHNVVVGITSQAPVVGAEELVVAGGLHEIGGPWQPKQMPLTSHI